MSRPIRISRNFLRGSQIRTARELASKPLGDGIVYVKSWNRISPVSFVLSMQFNVVMQFIQQGGLYNVKRIPDTRKKKCPWPRSHYNDKTGLYERID